MRAMIVKEFRELLRDHRTLAMVVVMPVMLLIVFGYAANFTTDTVTTAVVGPNAAAVESQLPDFFDVQSVSEQDPHRLLQSDAVDVAIDTSTTPPTAYLDGADMFAAQSALVVLGHMGAAVQTEVLYNPDLTTSWMMIPGIIGLIMTFIGTVVTSIGLVREREVGTLEQLAVMPIRPSAVIFGKIIPYFFVALFDIAVVTLLGTWLFDVPMNGQWWELAVGAALFLLVVLGLGVFVSTISHTVGQAIQTAFFFLLPQILLSGMIFPLNAMPVGVRWIGYALPLTYFTQISRGIMLRGAGMSDLWVDYLVLAVMAILILGAAIWRFRSTLAPRVRRAGPARAEHGRHEQAA